MKSKKGFTLLELSIVIAVSAIAMAMLSVVMMQTNSFVATKNLQTARLTETESFEKTFALAIEEFQSLGYSIQNAENQSQIVFWGQGESNVILFQENTLWKNEESLAEFQEIQNVSFTNNDNIIKCTLAFDENTTHTLIFTKRI
ncbi:MAG: type II secretion system protein [Clostridia bacterium]|nr:type II secretion system protein [Clostridia bacterium]